MVRSMTGYAAREGAAGGLAWSWEIRGVNGRGLDLRLRLPERAQALDKPVRDRLAAALGRGSVQVGLRLKAEGAGLAPALDPAALDALVRSVAQVRGAFEAAGQPVGPVDPVAVLALPGGLGSGEDESLPAEAILADFEAALSDFVAMRAEEGAALAGVLTGQLDTVAALVATAAERAGPRAEAIATRLREGVERLLSAAGGTLDEARLSQDLAALYVKGDVTEEIDRLTAHVAAARTLIAGDGPVGRKLDFLMQEFNREANTLCSKSQDAALTRAGLDLKVAIDQMREQVQNLE